MLLPFFFNYYLRVRRDSAVRAIRRFMAQRGAVIETIAINNLQYELWKTDIGKYRGKFIIFIFNFIAIFNFI